MKNKAFTLIETLMGVTLITVVLTAVTGLILSTLISNQRNVHLLQASFLAQEGIEVMRYMRDSNWLQNYSWNGGATEWGGDFDLGADKKELEMYLTQSSSCSHQWCFTSDEERIDEFVRKIVIRVVDGMEGMVEVTAVISWNEKGVDRSYELSTYLTDWQQ